MVYPALRSLLPHRPPMILIDELVHCGPQEVVCAVTIRDDAPFVTDGRLPALISIEYFAQTVAAFYGYISQSSEQFTMGMLLGTRELELHTDFLHVGDALTITGRELWSGGNLAQFRCELHRGPELLAQAAITVLHAGAPP